MEAIGGYPYMAGLILRGLEQAQQAVLSGQRRTEKQQGDGEKRRMEGFVHDTKIAIFFDYFLRIRYLRKRDRN